MKIEEVKEREEIIWEPKKSGGRELEAPKNQNLEEAENKYMYVYGIINKDTLELNDIKGLRDDQVKKIDFEDISVLISFYPTLYPILNDKEAMQHASTLNEIAKKTTVIPMSFGTVFKNHEILEGVLSKLYPIIKETLKELNNKIELSVKLVKKLLYSDNGVSQKILEELNKLSVKYKKGDIFSERLLLNCAFLVEKDNFSEFSDKIGELEDMYKDLRFIYTGPWPPYSFVDINVRGK